MKSRALQWLVLFACPALSATPAACGGPAVTPMVSSPQTPAAQGTVAAAPGPNGNTSLSVEVRHLALPERVAPGAKVYVVWVVPHGGPPQNVGALRVDENLTGRLDTVTAQPSFEVTVTAEEHPAATMPRGPRVLAAVIAQ